MNGAIETVLTMLVFVVLPACIIGWVGVIRHANLGRPILEKEPRRPVPWNWVFLLLIGCVFLITVSTFQFVTISISGGDPKTFDQDLATPYQQWAMIMGFSAGMLASSLITVFMIFVLAGANASDLGISTQRIGYDIKLASWLFAMFIVPVMVMQLLLLKIFPDAGQHPFVKIIEQSGNSRLITGIAVAAIIVAPIAEELLFRVYFQGWLERLVTRRRYSGNDLSATVGHSSTELSSAVFNAEPVSDELQASPNQQIISTSHPHPEFEAESMANPFESPRLESLRPEPPAEVESDKTLWLPILASSLLFALAHLGHGPAPIPLFFLAIGFGYAYQKTHRIWPSLVAHAFVNSLAVIQLFGMSIR